MLDITAQMSEQEIINLIHSNLVVPIVWIVFLFMALIFLIVGLVLINNKKSGYSKFFMIWGISTFLGAVFSTFLTLSPNIVIKLAEGVQRII